MSETHHHTIAFELAGQKAEDAELIVPAHDRQGEKLMPCEAYEEENRVLAARLFSIYRGRPVVRIGGVRGRSFSLGALFISPKLKPDDKDAIDTLRHEYGHALQLERIGWRAYLRHIALPSVRSTLTGYEYYAQPWEITADILGGVDRHHDEQAVHVGESYLAALPVRGDHV